MRNFKWLFGQLAQGLNYLTGNQVDHIIVEQKRTDHLFGEIAIEMGYLTESQIFQILEDQNQLNVQETNIFNGHLTHEKNSASQWGLFKGKSRYNEQSALYKFFLEYPFEEIDPNDGYKIVIERLNLTLSCPCYYVYLRDDVKNLLILEHVTLISEDQKSNFFIKNRKINPLLKEPEISLRINPTQKKIGLSRLGTGMFLSFPLLYQDKEFLGIILCGPYGHFRVSNKIKRFLVYFSNTAAASVKRISNVKRLKERNEILVSRLRACQTLLGVNMDMHRFMSYQLDKILSLIKTEAGLIEIYNTKHNQSEIRVSKNLTEEFIHSIQFEWNSNAPIVIQVKDYSHLIEYKLRSFVAIPLVIQNKLYGVFALFDFNNTDAFSHRSTELLKRFVNQFKLLFTNYYFVEKLGYRFVDTYVSMAKLLDADSRYKNGHSQRIADIAAEIASALNIAEERVEMIRTAGLMHDVMSYSLRVEDNTKNWDKLTSVNSDLLEILPLPSDIMGGIRSNREWYDGLGYPDGMRGETIPLSARILSVAQYFVQATSNNQIQCSFGWKELLDNLNLRKGKQFDPNIVDTLIELLNKKRSGAVYSQLMPCWKFKGRPEKICSSCIVFEHFDNPCWAFAEIQCSGHGDDTCESCFIFKERNERLEQSVRNKNLKSADNVTLDYSRKNNVPYISLTGDIHLTDYLTIFNILSGLNGEEKPEVILDFSHTTSVDDHIIHLISLYARLYNKNHGLIRIIDPHDDFQERVQFFGTDKFLEYHKDKVSAMNNYSKTIFSTQNIAE